MSDPLAADDCAYECPFTREGHESGSVNVDHDFVVSDPSRYLDLDDPETVEQLADILMDARMDGPYAMAPSTLTYQASMRSAAAAIRAALRERTE